MTNKVTWKGFYVSLNHTTRIWDIRKMSVEAGFITKKPNQCLLNNCNTLPGKFSSLYVHCVD